MAVRAIYGGNMEGYRMNAIRPEGHLSITEYALVCGVRESHVRTQLSEGKIPSIKVGQRRWISESAVSARLAELLTSPWTQEVTLKQLRANAAVARVELLSNEELVANAEAYLRGENPRVDTPERDPWVAPTRE